MKGMKGSRAQLGVNAFQREMDESMARMMQDMHGPGYVGQADIDFLAMMIPHHAGAVDMARLVLQHGRDPATRQLAEEIIAGQTIEIESMTRRLAALQQAVRHGFGGRIPLAGRHAGALIAGLRVSTDDGRGMNSSAGRS
jgi:uncharacterized protein (DUF305 family)